MGEMKEGATYPFTLILSAPRGRAHHPNLRALPADKSIHIDLAAPGKGLRLRATRCHDLKTPGARELARPPAQQTDNQARQVLHRDPPVPSLHPRKTRQKLGHNLACEAD